MRSGEIQHPQHAAQRERHRHQHDEGVEPTLEVDHQKQVDQHHGECHATKQPGVTLAHGVDLAAQLDLDRGRQDWPLALQHGIDRLGRRFQIASLHVGMHIEHRPDVQLRGHHGRAPARDAGHIHQQGRIAAPGSGQRHASEILGTVELIGGLLHDQGIAHAAVRVHPEVRVDLGARIGGHQHVARGGRLVEAERLGHGPVHVHRQRRGTRNLKHVRVHHPGHMSQLPGQARRHGIGLVRMGAGDADIDRCRLAKIQHLIDDVGRLEKELQRGKRPGQYLPQARHMIGRRGMRRFQRDQDLAVHRADRGRIAQGNVDAAVGQADVVEQHIDLVLADGLADLRLDLRKPGLRGLEPAARGRPHMESHLTGIDLRKEVPSQFREQGEGGPHQAQEEQTGAERTGETDLQHVAVALADALKAILKRVMHLHQRVARTLRRDACRGIAPRRLLAPLQQEAEQHRHQREGQRQAAQQGQADRKRQG